MKLKAGTVKRAQELAKSEQYDTLQMALYLSFLDKSTAIRQRKIDRLQHKLEELKAGNSKPRRN